MNNTFTVSGAFAAYMPRVLPNNTLIADLTMCHPNLIHQVPQLGFEATSKRLLENIKKCWQPKRQQQQQQQQQQESVQQQQPHQNNQPPYHIPIYPQPQPLPLSLQTKRRRALKFEMPEALRGAAGVKLRCEDYDRALCVLTSDFRYQLHLFLYARVQSIWLLASTIICMFIPFVFMAPELAVLGVSTALWLTLQVVGALATFALRRSLNRCLERAVAQANSYFMDHNLMLGVINLGGMFSKSKLCVPLVYFDTTPCRRLIESTLKVNGFAGDMQRYALTSAYIVLMYSQRWISQYDRRKLVFSGDDDDKIEPRHLSTGKCICQFFEAQYVARTRKKTFYGTTTASNSTSTATTTPNSTTTSITTTTSTDSNSNSIIIDATCCGGGANEEALSNSTTLNCNKLTSDLNESNFCFNSLGSL